MTVSDRPLFDVFLCHNTADKPAVRKIGVQLQDLDLKPWLNVDELRPGEPWQPLVEQQIGTVNAAAVFIGADGAGPWQSEELRAFLQEYKNRGCRVIPVILHSAPEGTELLPFLRNYGWVDFRIAEPEPIGQLYWGITGEKLTKKAIAPVERRLAGAEQVRDVPLWVGRDALLEDLRKELLEERRKVLVLVGQGGIGKTSLAVKLLEACGVSRGVLLPECVFGRVVYVRVRQGMSFDEVMAELGRGLEVSLSDGLKPGQMIDAVMGGLQRDRCLLVLDNLEDVLKAGRSLVKEWGELLWAIVERQHRSQMVITSRERPLDLADPRDASGMPNPSLVQVKIIEGIDKNASIELLKQLGLRDSEDDLRWVAQRVAGQVQVLTLLAKWAQKPGMLRKRPDFVTADAKPILRVQVAKQSGAAQDLLKRLGVLRVGIEVEGLTFLRLYRDAESEFEAAEIAETQNLVNVLVSCSLVQEQYDEQRCLDTYSLHRVIVEFMQAEYASELHELMKNVYSFYCSGMNVEQPKTLEDLRPVLEAQHFAFQLESYGEAEDLLYELEKYLKPWGHWVLLKQLCEQIVDRLPETSQPRILQILGIREQNWGNWDAAENYYQAGLKLAEKNDQTKLIARLTGNLGDIELNRGNWDAAERLFRQSLQLREELGDRSGMASSIGCLGENELGRGNLNVAETLLQDALSQMQQLGRIDGIAETNWNLAKLYRAKNNSVLAQQHYTTAYQLFTQLGAKKQLESIEKEWGM